jgi:hypothetical protein
MLDPIATEQMFLKSVVDCNKYGYPHECIWIPDAFNVSPKE